MRYTNQKGVRPYLAKLLERANALSTEAYDGPSGPGIITATQLTSPAQALQLQKEHQADLEMDVLDTVPALEGTAIHYMLQKAAEGDPNLVAERRMAAFHDGWVISAKTDLYVIDERLVVDYKRGSVWSFIYGKPEWTAQVNVGAWILKRNGIPVKAVEIALFPGDWRRSEARKMGDYPIRAQGISVPLWSDDEQTAYVDSRLHLHRQMLPPCSKEERWAKPDSWAVRKDGNKKASRIYDSEADAVKALGPGQVIEHRPGESVRCAGGYCLGAPFCVQWAKDPTNPKNQPEEA